VYYMIDIAMGQWDSGTQNKVVACVLDDERSSGTVGHRAR
jgi:hypothetical protein